MAEVSHCYKAFLAGDLIPPISPSELNQIHPDDVEEMDVTWSLANAVFRAQRFYERTGKVGWGGNAHTRRFDKSKLRCFNCHEPGHFAQDCKKPSVEQPRENWSRENKGKTAMAVMEHPRASAPQNTETGMVTQHYSWADQFNALQIDGSSNNNGRVAHLAQIEEDAAVDHVKAQVMNQVMDHFAFMVADVPDTSISTPPSIFSEVNEIACSDLCLARIKSYIE